MLHVRLDGQADANGHRQPYLLTGLFDDFRVLPPAWRFLDPRDGADVGLGAFPAPGPFPGGSVLHPNGVICAPWNRLAYKNAENPSGVHDNWTDLTSWETLEPNHTQARTIPDMLARIHSEVSVSPSRLASLPVKDSSADQGAA